MKKAETPAAATANKEAQGGSCRRGVGYRKNTKIKASREILG